MEILYPVSRVFALTTAAAAVPLSYGRHFLLCNSNQSVAIEVNDSVYLLSSGSLTGCRRFLVGGASVLVLFYSFSETLEPGRLRRLWSFRHQSTDAGALYSPAIMIVMECRTWHHHGDTATHKNSSLEDYIT